MSATSRSIKAYPYLSKRVLGCSTPALSSYTRITTRSQSSASATNSPFRNNPQPYFTSTIQHSERKDFSTHVATIDDPSELAFRDEHYNALHSAFQMIREKNNAVVQTDTTASAREMDLVEAAWALNDPAVDKIILLLRHGEAEHNIFEQSWIDEGNDPDKVGNSEDYPIDPELTSRGIGQMLNVSRRTSSFCTRDTGLIPDLVVVSPLRRATQSALLAFPQLAPGCIRNIPWICHPGCMEQSNNGRLADFVSCSDDLELNFPGIDYSLYNDRCDIHTANDRERRISRVESKLDLLNRTNDFLSWLKEREERVIVVSSHSTWLQSFCGFSLNYEPYDNATEMFKTGEMRAVGLKFD